MRKQPGRPNLARMALFALNMTRPMASLAPTAPPASRCKGGGPIFGRSPSLPLHLRLEPEPLLGDTVYHMLFETDVPCRKLLQHHHSRSGVWLSDEQREAISRTMGVEPSPNPSRFPCFLAAERERCYCIIWQGRSSGTLMRDRALHLTRVAKPRGPRAHESIRPDCPGVEQPWTPCFGGTVGI